MPVSYTHLDVYKRQELYMNSELLVNAPFDLENGEIFHCNLTLASGNSHVASNGVETVSYTHLDVYKRQRTLCGGFYS